MRLWNFAAGPATIPLEVLEQVRAELPDWHGVGCGVMEMSHRGKIYTGIYEKVVADLRQLMNIPEDYAILFLQGGATLQFSQIPMNLLDGGSADYLTTGAWSVCGWPATLLPRRGCVITFCPARRSSASASNCLPAARRHRPGSPHVAGWSATASTSANAK